MPLALTLALPTSPSPLLVAFGAQLLAFGAQLAHQLLLVAVGMGHVPKRRLGQREDRRCIAAAFGPDRDRGHSKCPDRSRLVAR